MPRKRKGIQHPVAPCSSESTMSLHTTTTSQRGHVRADAQLAHAAEQSRHEISKLALGLLQQRHHAQDVVNVENKQRAMTLVENKLSAAAAELAARHGKEVTDLEDAKFALFEEFDTRRVAWASATGAVAQLAEDASKHAALIEVMTAGKLREEDEARQTLESTIDKLRRGLYACVSTPKETNVPKNLPNTQ